MGFVYLWVSASDCFVVVFVMDKCKKHKYLYNNYIQIVLQLLGFR